MARQRYVSSEAARRRQGQQRYVSGETQQRGGGRTRYTGGPSQAQEVVVSPGAPKKKEGGGFLHDLYKYSGAELGYHLVRDVPPAATGFFPSVYRMGKVGVVDPWVAALHGRNAFDPKSKEQQAIGRFGGEIEKQYSGYYGSNVRHNIYEHPLQLLLDVGTVADLGATAGARAGLIKSGRATLETRSPRAIATGEGPVATKLTGTKPLVRGRQVGMSKLGRSGKVQAAATKMEEATGGRLTAPFAESARYGKEIRTNAQLDALRQVPIYRTYRKAMSKLDEIDTQALNVLGRGMTPNEYRAYLLREAANHGTQVDHATLAILDNPKLAERVDNPTRKIINAYNASAELGERAAELSGIEPGVAEARKYLPYATVKGLRSRDPVRGANATGEIERMTLAGMSPEAIGREMGGRLIVDIGKPTRLDQATKELDSRIAALQHELSKPVGIEEQLALRGREIKAQTQAVQRPGRPPERDPRTGELITPGRAGTTHVPTLMPTAREAAQTQLEQLQRLRARIGTQFERESSRAATRAREHLANPRVQQSLEPAHFGLPLDEIRQRFAEEGRLPPIYLPDVARVKQASNPFHAFGGGKGVQSKLGTSRLNRGILIRLGKLELSGDVLGPEFLRRVRYTTFNAIHDHLIDASLQVSESQLDAFLAEHGGIPSNWEYIRAPIKSKAGNVRSQQISKLRQAEAETHVSPEELADLLPNPDKVSESKLADVFTTRTRDEAFTDPEGNYYLAPKNMVRRAAGEYHRSSAAVRYIIEKPLSVWRAIVLGLRPGFLTNNVVGNHLMLAARTAGHGALRSYLHTVQDHWGTPMVKRLLDQEYVPKGMRKDLMNEFFPEQTELGTFGRTQSPAREGLLPQAGGKVVRGVRAAAGAIPAASSKLAEVGPRQAATEAFIRSSPEFKSAYRSMPKETRSFEAALRKVTSGEGGKAYQRYVSSQVNDTLGSYLNLSPLERNTVRNIFPFYAWYRAIATVTGKMALDTPGRALAIYQLGQIGNQWVESILGTLPSFLQGVIPIRQNKDGTYVVVGTSGFNPYATLTQLGRGFSDDVNSLGMSPFLGAILNTYARKTQHHGHVSAPQLLALALGDIVRALPPARLIKPLPPSDLYPKRSRKSELESYLGLPVKEPRLWVAHEQAREGR